MLASGETCECWMSVGQVCECCMLATEHQARPVGGVGGPVKQVMGPGIQAEATTDRGSVPVLRRAANMSVLVNPESVVCVPALVNICLYYLKRT